MVSFTAHILGHKLYCLEEGLDFLFALQSSPVLDVFDLSQVGRHPLFQVNVAKPHDCLLTQLTFLASELNFVVMQPLEACVNIIAMFIAFAVYEDVLLDDQHIL